MKILQIFGVVIGIHLFAFIAIFASPGCQSGSSNVPTPDATAPTVSEVAPVTFSPGMANPPPVDLSAPASSNAGMSTASHATPTRPGSAAAVAVEPEQKLTPEVAPVSTYTVTRGDSLWTIAKKNHLTVSELAKANNLSTGSALQPGKKLIIPIKPGSVAAATAMKTAPGTAPLPMDAAATGTGPTLPKPAMESVKHTVQVGESLGVIARKYQVSVGELAAANNITDPSKVRAGQQLVIPGFKAISSKGSNTKSSGKASTKPAAVDKTPAASTTTPTVTPTPAVNTPNFQIAPPPPGQDLDSGLKDTGTEVPTIKVEDSSEPKK